MDSYMSKHRTLVTWVLALFLIWLVLEVIGGIEGQCIWFYYNVLHPGI